MKGLLTILFFNSLIVYSQTTKLAPLYISIPSYTQVQEDSVKLTYDSGVTGQYIWNTDLLKTRIWGGVIFTNAPELPANALPIVSPTLPGAITQSTLNAKQNTITTGSAAQYFRGDLSLATFPTTTAAFINSTNKNFVTDAQATVIGNTSGTNSGDNATNTQYSGLAASKQNTLVSATNIKTINGTTILGSGDLVVAGAAAWGSVTGTLSNQTDLQTALDSKLPKPTTSGVGASPTASGTQTITHNLGRVPSVIRIYGYGSFTANAAATATTSSMGIFSSSGNFCVYQRYGAAITTTQAGLSSSAFAILLATGGGNFISGVIQNVGATSFDIQWTETGTATAQVYLWEAQQP